MYFRIYKALNVLLWMIPCRKKVWDRRWSTRLNNTPFAGMSVLVKDLFLLEFDKHSSLFIQLLHTYIMLYILFKLI